MGKNRWRQEEVEGEVVGAEGWAWAAVGEEGDLAVVEKVGEARAVGVGAEEAPGAAALARRCCWKCC